MILEKLRQIGPGIYARESTGELHLVIPEILRAGGYADTPENRETMLRAARELAAEDFPGVPITES